MVADFAWLLGVLTLGLLSPGPDFLIVVRNSLDGSRSRALATVAGIVAGLALQSAVLAGGFAAAPPAMLRAVQWIGALFLAYLGIRGLLASTATPSPETTASAGTASPGLHRGFLEGFLCNVTNPKAFLFFLSLYAQLLRPGEESGLWRVMLPVAIVAHAAVAWTLVALAVQSPPIALRLRRAQRWLPRAFGAALLGLALWTAWGAAHAAA